MSSISSLSSDGLRGFNSRGPYSIARDGFSGHQENGRYEGTGPAGHVLSYGNGEKRAGEGSGVEDARNFNALAT